MIKKVAASYLRKRIEQWPLERINLWIARVSSWSTTAYEALSDGELSDAEMTHLVDLVMGDLDA